MEELAKEIIEKSNYVRINKNDSDIGDHIFEYNYDVGKFGIELADSIYENEIDENLYKSDYDKALKKAKSENKYKTDAEIIVKNEMADRKKKIEDKQSSNKKYLRYLDSFKIRSEAQKGKQILDMSNNKKQFINEISST